MSYENQTAVKPLLFVASLVLFVLSFLAGLELWHGLHQAMVHIFLVFGFILILRHLILLYAAWRRNSELPKQQQSTYYPSISIIIPAFNEEAVIKESLSSLLLLDYPDYEVIMVDDGSSDGTVAIVNELKSQQSNVPIKSHHPNKLRKS